MGNPILIVLLRGIRLNTQGLEVMVSNNNPVLRLKTHSAITLTINLRLHLI